MCEGGVFVVGVEVGGVGESFGIGCEPPAGFWVVVAPPEIDEVCFVIVALGSVAPRALDWGGEDVFLFAKGGVLVEGYELSCFVVDESYDVSKEVVDWKVGDVVKFDSNGGSDFCCGCVS